MKLTSRRTSEQILPNQNFLAINAVRTLNFYVRCILWVIFETNKLNILSPDFISILVSRLHGGNKTLLRYHSRVSAVWGGNITPVRLFPGPNGCSDRKTTDAAGNGSGTRPHLNIPYIYVPKFSRLTVSVVYCTAICIKLPYLSTTSKYLSQANTLAMSDDRLK